jgi:hypothetical protein
VTDQTKTHRLIALRVPVDLFEAVQRAADAEDRSVSAVVRVALRRLLADQCHEHSEPALR